MILRLTWVGAPLSALLLTGCIFVGDFDEHYELPPAGLTYEVCYTGVDCSRGDYCQELALPADLHTDHVNAICTFQCFDDLDCPVSEFNLFPGACVDQRFFGAVISTRICLERCEVDADCDVGAGFGCELIAWDRLCVPVH
jgi:hypothetical protein